MDAIATGLGAASSSCSYAAVALARSLFRTGDVSMLRTMGGAPTAENAKHERHDH
jgi:hypothetical protein